MRGQNARVVSTAIRYIEDHLGDKLGLEQVAEALHYSRCHLHRIFTRTVGMTLHDYVGRRQLTEAARLLVFTKRPILEIAMGSGYESQQAFTTSFKAMYKKTPAEFREAESFYPLQLKIHLKEELVHMDLTIDHIQAAAAEDVEDWMELVRLAIDGYPCLEEAGYRERLLQYIRDGRAFILRDEGMAVGAMAFSRDTGNIDFLAVHPQYRGLGIMELFLEKLTEGPLKGREITVSTYRAGDRADTGYREGYKRLGFVERGLLVEYGYPTQQLVLCLRNGEADPEGQNVVQSDGLHPAEEKEGSDEPDPR